MGAHPHETLRRIEELSPPPIEAAGFAGEPQLQRILTKALWKDPERRHASAPERAEALSFASGLVNDRARRVTDHTRAARRQRNRGQPRFTNPIFLVVAAVAVLVGLVLGRLETGASPSPARTGATGAVPSVEALRQRPHGCQPPGEAAAARRGLELRFHASSELQRAALRPAEAAESRAGARVLRHVWSAALRNRNPGSAPSLSLQCAPPLR